MYEQVGFILKQDLSQTVTYALLMSKSRTESAAGGVSRKSNTLS